MTQEEILEKMEQIKKEIEQEPSKSVENIRYLGDINIEDEIKKIFLIIEQQLNENGDVVNQYSDCYTEDGVFLGRYVEYIDSIIVKEEFNGMENVYNQLNGLDVKGKIDLKEIEKQQIEQIAKALGIEEDEIKSLSSMELVQKIEQKQDAKENPEEDEQALDEEETKTITNGKQEIKLGTRVDEYKTLGKALDLNESEYSKVVIVYSERLQEIQKDEPINNTTYSFVAIKKDGTAEIINDRLKVDERTGNNSLKESIKVDANEKAREDNKTKTRFQIIGKNGEKEGKSDYEKETLSVEAGQYGEIKAYYGKGRTSRENENVETQLETANVRPTSLELRRLQAERKGIYKDNNDEISAEAKSYLENGNEEVSMYSADGNANTVVLADYVEKNKEEIVAKIMHNEVIAESEFGKSDIEEKLQKLTEDENDRPYTIEEIEQRLEEVEKEIEEDAGYFPERNRR